MLRLSSLAILLLIAGLCLGQTEFQRDPAAGARFADALRLFTNGDYAGALPVFDSLRKAEPLNQTVTSSWVMAGKSLFRLREYRASVQLLNDFLRKYPDSRFSPDVRYTLALDFLMLQDHHDAALHLLHALDSAGAPGLFPAVVGLFRTVARDQMGATEIRDLMLAQTTRAPRDLTALALAEKLYLTGRSQEIGPLLEPLGTGSLAAEAASLRQRLSHTGAVSVGVLLPLTTPTVEERVRSVANEIMAGINAALKYERSSGSAGWTPDIEVKETGSDSASTVAGMRALTANPSTIAVIGPLFSSMAQLTAPIAEKAGVTMITPTAASDGIAAIGRHVFQATPDYSTRGRLMAQYAIKELGFRRLAVLGSGDLNARAMAKGFIHEAKRLGAVIIAEETFTPGSTDLRDQFIDLRTAGFRVQGVKASPENLDVPCDGAEGVYLPISGSADIGVLASQMRYFNIRTQMLGSNEWFDMGQLDSQKRYLNGILITTDWFDDPADTTAGGFQRAWGAVNGRKPTHYAKLGYDVMHLICRKLASGASTRESLRATLASSPGGEDGLSFTSGRVNSTLQILKYSNGEILHLGEVSPGH
jgi:branched-chain amino acid transport system substrate-binding protein